MPRMTASARAKRAMMDLRLQPVHFRRFAGPTISRTASHISGRNCSARVTCASHGVTRGLKPLLHEPRASAETVERTLQRARRLTRGLKPPLYEIAASCPRKAFDTRAAPP